MLHLTSLMWRLHILTLDMNCRASGGSACTKDSKFHTLKAFFTFYVPGHALKIKQTCPSVQQGLDNMLPDIRTYKLNSQGQPDIT